jgi:hypothetical protein
LLLLLLLLLLLRLLCLQEILRVLQPGQYSVL